VPLEVDDRIGLHVQVVSERVERTGNPLTRRGSLNRPPAEGTLGLVACHAGHVNRRNRTHPAQYVFLALNTAILLIWSFFQWRHVFTGAVLLAEVLFAALSTVILLAYGWVWWLAVNNRLPRWTRPSESSGDAPEAGKG